MVHPEARTAIVTAPVGEVPVGVDAFLGMDVPDRIDPTTIKHLGISLPALREVDSVADPSPRHCGIDRGWHNIIVAAKNAWCFLFEQQVAVADQTIEPPQLVVEFWAR